MRNAYAQREIAAFFYCNGDRGDYFPLAPLIRYPDSEANQKAPIRQHSGARVEIALRVRYLAIIAEFMVLRYVPSFCRDACVHPLKLACLQCHYS